MAYLSSSLSLSLIELSNNKCRCRRLQRSRLLRRESVGNKATAVAPTMVTTEKNLSNGDDVQRNAA